MAATVVALHHVGAFLLADTDWFVFQARGGFLGVEIFFVLSGFLITTLLLEEAESSGRIRLSGFYWRRALRLGPALVFVLVAWSAYLVAVGVPGRRIAGSVALVGTYTTNYYKTAERDVVPGLGHLWTLAIEEQFYLLWPLALVLLLAFHVRHRIIVGVLAAAILGITLNRAWVFGSADHIFDVYFRTDTHVDGLLWGAVLSFAWRAGWVRPGRWRGISVAAALALAAFTFGPSAHLEPGARGASLTLLSVLSCALVIGALDHDWWLGRCLSCPALDYLGDRSYAIYLWHVPVIVVVAREYHGSAAVQALLALAGTLLMAEVSWRLVERPVSVWARARRSVSATLPSGPERAGLSGATFDRGAAGQWIEVTSPADATATPSPAGPNPPGVGGGCSR